MKGSGQKRYKGKFNVAGTSFRTDAVVEMIKFIYQSGSAEPYGGYSGRELKEILEDGEPFYKYQHYYTSDVSFVPEPDNKYDPNAVLVVVGGKIEVGYVPKEYLEIVRNVLDCEGLKIDVLASIIGGPYKRLDFIEDKVISEKNPNLGVQLQVTISETSDEAENIEQDVKESQLVLQPQQEVNYNNIGCGCCLFIVIFLILSFINSVSSLF